MKVVFIQPFSLFANTKLVESLDTADASATELSRVIENFIAVTEE